MNAAMRALRIAGRVVWWLAWLAMFVWLHHLSVGLIGRQATAAVVAVVVVAGLVGAWGMYVEPRLFPSSSTKPAPGDIVAAAPRRTTYELDHVAFARALVAVSSAYLDQCERRRDGSTRTGFCERHR